ncbi:hypothetical protein [Natrarchaeobius chitinivorans]|uniref:Uncharacterized protein n=1 Tax=Natrarchaeobius chitinivorans TaxID=1679083 RepID=A0A3N6MII5_NATCH|nr:hypothetical protein [Natrarchaeobius chitinivorans]RQG95481.1 hypothetical protein EA473_08460 [Natrarchaeobius chitinivorans]
MVEHYDKVLAGIAGSLLGGVLLGLLTSVSFSAGLFAGTLVATLFVYDAMFRNPPLPPSDPRVAASAIVWHAILFGVAVATYLT